MKKIIVRMPETVAHDFKVMCAILKTSQNAVIQKLIEKFLEKQNNEKMR